MVNTDAVPLGFPPYTFDHTGNRRFTEIDEIHRNLGASFHKQTQCLDVTQTTRRMTNGFGDFLGNIHILCGEIDIECDQWIARANNRRPCRTDLCRTVIGLPVRVRRNFSFECLVLPPADVFKVSTFWAGCRRFI